METKEQDIRKWKTYDNWKTVLKEIEKLDKFETLLFIHKLMEDKRAYRYNWIFEVNEIALRQLIKDTHLKP